MMTGQRPDTGRRGVPVRRHHWPAVAEWGGVAVIATWLTSAGTAWGHVGPYLPSGAMMIAGLVTVVMTVVSSGSAALGGVAAGWAVSLAGWLAWARLTGSTWTAGGVAALVIPAVLMACWTVICWAVYDDEERRAAAADAKARQRADLAAWDRKLEAAGITGVRATAVTAARQGKDIRLKLDGSGATLSTLASRAEAIATVLKLAPESVTFEIIDHAADVMMHLNEADILADDIPFPSVAGHLTVTQPIPVGLRGDGAAALVMLREIATLIIGVTGSGKSNLLNVLLAQLTRCEDVIVIGIDLKGGRLFAPWIRPWVHEQCARPAVDWVATTREEAEVVLRAVDDLINARASSLEGGSKLTPSMRRPQVVVLADEIADIFGDIIRSEQGSGTSNVVMATLGSRITRKLRSEAVSALWATQRGTSTMTGGGDIKSQCKQRFALACSTEADARTVIPDDYTAAKLLARLRHPGSGLVWRPGHGKPQPVKFYRLDPDLDKPHGRADMARITELAIAAGNYRPALPPEDLSVLGARYADRWERSELYRTLRAELDGAAAPAPGHPAAATATAVRPGGQSAVPDTPAATTAAFTDIMSAEGMTGDGKPDARNRMYALLAEKPEFGLAVMEIRARLDAEAIAPARETIHRWLAADIDAGRIERLGSGAGARYRFRADTGQDLSGG